MKKNIVALLTAGVLAVLTGCAGVSDIDYDPSSDTASAEETEQAEGPGEEAGTSEDSTSDTSENDVDEYDGGLRVVCPDEFKNTKGIFKIRSYELDPGTGIFITDFDYAGVTEEWLEKAFGGTEDPSEEDQETYSKALATFTEVITINGNRSLDDLVDAINEYISDNETELGSDEKVEKASFKELKKVGECTFFRMDKYDRHGAENLEEGFKEEFETLYGKIDDLLENVDYFEPVSPFEHLAGKKVEFETTDIDGNAVTSEEIFSQNEITMVNVWATWCYWCVYELPELNEVNKRLAEKNCAIVGLVGDGTDEATIKEAKKMLKENGDEYLNILPWDGALTEDFPMDSGWPTSFFVDREGRIVGTPVVGAAIDTYEEAIDQILENGKAEGKAEDPSPVTENNAGQYRIYVSDTDGNGVSGAMIQFCDDSTCKVEMTDDTGLAAFKADKGDYTVHVLKQPQGYKEDNTEYKLPDEYSDLHITLEKE
ncbi:MAG: redoxin family protein [Lachnospiraceae bacterium]|nr:redoxin family protein [Lachnospiraceae bacterium]